MSDQCARDVLEYVAQLEHKVDELEEEILDLKAKLAMNQGRKHSKKELVSCMNGMSKTFYSQTQL